jgi:hypothetical protein
LEKYISFVHFVGFSLAIALGNWNAAAGIEIHYQILLKVMASAAVLILNHLTVIIGVSFAS